MGQAAHCRDLADSPGKLCKSFQLTRDLCGADLTGDELFLEDWDIWIDPTFIRAVHRVGISARHDGHDAPLRYHLPSGLPDRPPE